MANVNAKTTTEVPRKAFTIDADNNIGAFSGEVPGAASFASAGDLATISTEWPAKRLVEIWNRLPGVAAVSKFTDRKTAVRRIWQELTGSQRASGGPHAGAKPAERRTSTVQPGTKLASPGTKTERIIALLKRPEGATLKAIMAATGWQPHSVRGFVSAQLTKRMGLKVRSFKRAGERVYKIRSN